MPSWHSWLFWVCMFAIAYPYAIYPLLLVCGNRVARRRLSAGDPAFQPTATVICPVHNESSAIGARVENLLALDYPREKLEILVVGDGCTDDSLGIAARAGGGRVTVVPLQYRGGKAAALNAGLERANGEIVVFTDAGIRTEAGALRVLLTHFSDRAIGCVSGEDRILGATSEGLYGRLELLLRREEAKLHSIAGASGCLYAVRRSLSRPFQPGMAPDFLSVLDTVRSGYRAICEPGASGTMVATYSQRAEFARKTRTFLRGITTVFGNASLLNPVRYPVFSFILISHKLMRWLVPLALIGCLVTSFVLREVTLYRMVLQLQVIMYAIAVSGLAMPRLATMSVVVRFCSFFLLVNIAAAKALGLWLVGVRREVWEPTRRTV